MTKNKKPALFSNSLWMFFSSVKFSILIFVLLAITSIMGTLIPQNASPAEYQRAYGDIIYGIMTVFDLSDMYHAWWYQFLLIILVVNIIICSIDRIYKTRKILFPGEIPVNMSRFLKLSDRQEFDTQAAGTDIKDRLGDFLKKKIGKTHVNENDDGFSVYAESGRWTRFGVYVVHLSLIFMLFGAVVGNIFGFDGYVNINEGESTDRIMLQDRSGFVKLDFEIRCDDFNVDFYDTGSPKEFRSDLVIVEDGEEVLKKRIVVNDPLRYRGINMFQSSYGQGLPESMTIAFESGKSGLAYNRNVTFNEKIEIPENLGTFELKNFTKSYNFKGQNLGNAFLGELISEDGKKEEVPLPVRFSRFDQMRKGNVNISVTDYKSKHYTGLQVTRDPGVIVVYLGCIMMIMGCYVTFFMSHKQVCLIFRRKDGKKSVVVSGVSNKNKFGMKRNMKIMTENLESYLK